MSILQRTAPDAQRTAAQAGADEQSALAFILSRIKTGNHRALVRHLTDSRQLAEVRPYVEQYRGRSAAALAQEVKASRTTLPLAAICAAVIILGCVKSGDPLDRYFPAVALPDTTGHELENDDPQWLASQVRALTDHKLVLRVSDWAERNRYLPRQVTSMPGFYSFDVAPYLREIADCVSVDSPVREVDLMKGAQIGATVGVLENAIGYVIEHVRSAPCMLLTADAELAHLRVDAFITPMLQHSGLEHLIRSSDESNKRKTGKTRQRIEWAGGGYLVPFGARNADKLRSISIQYLLEDEVDAYPPRVGKDGDPQALAEARTNAFYDTRKIVRLSTPLLKGSSRIHAGFQRGDQRRYYVPCKKCGQFQHLVFQGGRKRSDETPYGLVWDLDEGGELAPGSVRYLCKYCQHPHRDADKSWLLPRGEWRATSKARTPDRRSYHISALYAPVGMFPWEAVALAWLDAWDEETKTAKSVDKLQEFYNNVLGEPFAKPGASVRFAAVSAHRRTAYVLGQVPNRYAQEHSGSPVLFLTCQVDVHKRNLAVSVFGWTQDARSYVVDYWRFEAPEEGLECTELSCPVWGRLQELIEETEYVADDGTAYRVLLTVVDASYTTDTVVSFCGQYDAGVYPILGRERPAKYQNIKEFAPFKTQSGTVGYRVTVDHYKDRLAPVLRREWSPDSGLQRPYHFNAPVDLPDDALRELTAEIRREKTDERGVVTYEWHRPGNKPNELWDLLVYGHAAVEIIAHSICIEQFELPTVDWDQFWPWAADSENDELMCRSR